MMTTLPLAITGITGTGVTGPDGLVGTRPPQPERANPAVRITNDAVRAKRITAPCEDCGGARRRPLSGRATRPVSHSPPQKSSGLPTSIGAPRDLRTSCEPDGSGLLRAAAQECTRSTVRVSSGQFRQQIALTSHAAVALAREAGNAGQDRRGVEMRLGNHVRLETASQPLVIPIRRHRIFVGE